MRVEQNSWGNGNRSNSEMCMQNKTHDGSEKLSHKQQQKPPYYDDEEEEDNTKEQTMPSFNSAQNNSNKKLDCHYVCQIDWKTV